MSTGLKNHLLGSSSIANSGDLQSVMADGFIHIYGDQGSNGVPTDADAEINTTSDYTLLATIYSDGDTAGLELDDASGGVIQKASGETWDNSVKENLADGTAIFFLHTGSGESDGDSIGASTTEPRILGTVGTVGADLNLSSVSLVEDEVQEITNYSVTVGQ